MSNLIISLGVILSLNFTPGQIMSHENNACNCTWLLAGLPSKDDTVGQLSPHFLLVVL